MLSIIYENNVFWIKIIVLINLSENSEHHISNEKTLSNAILKGFFRLKYEIIFRQLLLFHQ